MAQNLLKEIRVKQDNGTMTDPVPMAAMFDYVFDPTTKYTLKQFFNNYMNYMQHADFIYYGSEKPTNEHVRIWIDTSENNWE